MTDYTALEARLRAPMWTVEPVDIRDIAKEAADAIAALRVQVAKWESSEWVHALIAERDVATEERDTLRINTRAMAFTIVSLRAENEALRKDAERYRYLRGNMQVWRPWWFGNDEPEKLDDAIDAAIISSSTTKRDIT